MISKLEILAIGVYQTVSHPIYSMLDKVHMNIFQCKYTPSCSVYAQEAITKYGAVKGTSLAIKRILRCNPHSHGGNDPLV
jgi:putative membrane protein insertion efficiency factor